MDRFYTNHLCNPKNHIFIPIPFSDHDIVILTLSTSSKPTTQTSLWKNNVSNFGHEQYKNEIIKLIETHSQTANTTHDKNPLENWQNLKKKIKQLLIKQAQDISKQKQHAHIIENQKLFKLRENMIAQPTKQNFELYHKQQKQIHNTFLSEARNNLLKSKANLEEYKNISLHTLYKQLAPEIWLIIINQVWLQCQRNVEQPPPTWKIQLQ